MPNQQHEAYATALSPPDRILPVESRCLNSETRSTHTTRSRNSFAYQRPFHPRLNPSLTDIRSWRNSLTSCEDLSVSSGIPGVGYYSGKGIKWVGEKILDCITAFEIRRRIWVIKRTVATLEKSTSTGVVKRLSRNEKQLHRLTDDLLELSSCDLFARLHH
jgi:hypothetical protein